MSSEIGPTLTPQDARRLAITRQWLDENEALRRHIVERLQKEGPLAPADFDQETLPEQKMRGSA